MQGPNGLRPAVGQEAGVDASHDAEMRRSGACFGVCGGGGVARHQGNPGQREALCAILKNILSSATLKGCAPAPRPLSRRKATSSRSRTSPLGCDGLALRRMRRRVRAEETDQTREPQKCWRIHVARYKRTRQSTQTAIADRSGSMPSERSPGPRRMRPGSRAKNTDRTREPQKCWRISHPRKVGGASAVRDHGVGTVEKSAVPVIAFHWPVSGSLATSPLASWG